MDPYRVLYVDPLAPESVIRAAYHALARAYHPDRNLSPEASHRMAELNQAYATIGTPQARAAYDRQNQRGRAAASVAVSPAAAPQPRVIVPPQQPSTRWTRPTSQPTPDTAVVMDFGRYQGWRLADIARTDREYLRWLRRSSGGGRFRTAIDRILAATPA